MGPHLTNIPFLSEGPLSGFDGGQSGPGHITVDGLVANWLLWKFDTTALWLKSFDLVCPLNPRRIKGQFLQDYRWGAILCPIEERGYNLGSGVWWEEGVRLRRTIIVVCGTNEKDGAVTEMYIFNGSEPTKPKWDKNSAVVGWEWRSVHPWDDMEPLPQMKRAGNFLIISML